MASSWSALACTGCFVWHKIGKGWILITFLRTFSMYFLEYAFSCLTAVVALVWQKTSKAWILNTWPCALSQICRLVSQDCCCIHLTQTMRGLNLNHSVPCRTGQAQLQITQANPTHIMMAARNATHARCRSRPTSRNKDIMCIVDMKTNMNTKFKYKVQHIMQICYSGAQNLGFQFNHMIIIMTEIFVPSRGPI